MATIIAAHDISGVGRCSLTAALAVLPAFGHTCHPLPTAVLSQQTGFVSYSYLDMTQQMPAYISAWKNLKLKPRMIYTGFLGNGRQAHLLSDFIKEHDDALIVIDPVMGDNSSLYGCFDDDFVNDMRELASHANILLPNATEFNLLCGKPPSQPFPDTNTEVLEFALRIRAPALEYVVITSGVHDGLSCNILVNIKTKHVSEIPCSHNGISYSGAGDLFASVLCSLIGNGKDISMAIKLAADFVSSAVKNTPENADTRYGVNYEPLLASFAAKNL